MFIVNLEGLRFLILIAVFKAFQFYEFRLVESLISINIDLDAFIG